MRLVVDASTLVAEAMRRRGRELIATAGLELVVAAEAWAEAEHEMRKRVVLLVARERVVPDLAGQLLTEVVAAVIAHVRVASQDEYADRVAEATWRIPRDPRDAPTVALALALDCGIWTGDRDFFGCGLPVWTTETLSSYLQRQVTA